MFYFMNQNYFKCNIFIIIPRCSSNFRISALTTFRDGGVSRSARSTWAFCSMHDQRRSQVYNVHLNYVFLILSLIAVIIM